MLTCTTRTRTVRVPGHVKSKGFTDLGYTIDRTPMCQPVVPQRTNYRVPRPCVTHGRATRPCAQPCGVKIDLV
ncbi:hypothetical protein F383_09019 [Gossypium arboreum]|uniref:Uncharacterized protein n=1 Tax=Gossypium arboreum TaxID=29729 RepID=A0A0B0P6B4_GOSAR|nr:hypothetical protein F383_09019 [Gossypium arboreum]